MQLKWRVRDLIDLEYFFQADDQVDDTIIQRRDRKIYLKDIAPALGKYKKRETTDSGTIIRLWLESRRREIKDPDKDEPVLPGKLFADSYGLLLIIFFISSTLIGTGLAFALLKYNGTEPVNVSSYIGILVLLQIVLVCGLLAFSLFRSLIPSFSQVSVFYNFLAVLLTGLFRKGASIAVRPLNADTRNHLMAVTGIVKVKKSIYGSVFFWLIFILAQIAGIGFNLGVLAASALKILVSDLAFGWQSTIQFSSQAVYMFLKTVALPWAWMVPSDLAYPTHPQIEGSRMVLKDGIYHLVTPDLVSWWPFLLLAVFFYGLLPRIILFGAGILNWKSALGNLNFNHASCNHLLRRLQTPILETEGGDTGNNGVSVRAEELADSDFHADDKKTQATDNAAIALIPDDIFEQCPLETLKILFQENLGINLKQRIKIEVDIEEDKKALTDAFVPDPSDGLKHIVVLQEAWQPPIEETLQYFRELRKLLKEEVLIHIFLIGKAADRDRFTSASSADWKIWKKAVQRIGDPFAGIAGLRNQ